MILNKFIKISQSKSTWHDKYTCQGFESVSGTPTLNIRRVGVCGRESVMSILSSSLFLLPRTWNRSCTIFVTPTCSLPRWIYSTKRTWKLAETSIRLWNRFAVVTPSTASMNSSVCKCNRNRVYLFSILTSCKRTIFTIFKQRKSKRELS